MQNRPAILAVMARTPEIAIVGPGRLGSALAKSLSRAGYLITEVISRHAPGSRKRASALAKSVQAHAATLNSASFAADLVWLCVPDRELAVVAEHLSPQAAWRGKFVFHSSGALTSDELNALRRRGANVASVHPLMTFVRGSEPSLQLVPFALEGDASAVALARKIARALGGAPFVIRKENKDAYHAWGAFASPLMVALLATTERIAGLAGISVTDARKKVLPIVRQTIDNYAALGPEKALTGPLVRGDVEIVRRHLRLLQKNALARAVYVALGTSAISGLPVRNRKEVRKALGRKS